MIVRENKLEEVSYFKNYGILLFAFVLKLIK